MNFYLLKTSGIEEIRNMLIAFLYGMINLGVTQQVRGRGKIRIGDWKLLVTNQKKGNYFLNDPYP